MPAASTRHRTLHSDETPCSPSAGGPFGGGQGARGGTHSGGPYYAEAGEGGHGDGDGAEDGEDDSDYNDDDFELYDSDDDHDLYNELKAARRPPSKQHERGQPPPAAGQAGLVHDHDARAAAPSMSQKLQAMRSRALRHLSEDEFELVYRFFSSPDTDHANARDELTRMLGGPRNSNALLLVEQLVFLERSGAE